MGFMDYYEIRAIRTRDSNDTSIDKFRLVIFYATINKSRKLSHPSRERCYLSECGYTHSEVAGDRVR